MAVESSSPFVLGIDLGSASIGWAVMDCKPGAADEPPEITGIRRCGARIFEAGVEGDIEQGKDASRAVKRRQARAQRRQLMRRARKQRHVYALLSRAGLLPQVESGRGDPTAYLKAIEEVDARLRPQVIVGEGAERHRQEQVFPYLLRARCVEGVASPEMLGRALYHLAQRRGFKSNRKVDRPTKDGEDLGQVKEAIKGLREEMGGKTLGQHFSALDPEARRIRQRWTDRGMYVEEFAKIREVQEQGHPELPASWWSDVEKAMFHQRPLKPAGHLVGKCPLEKKGDGRSIRVAPVALDVAQKFRYLQKVNDLNYVTPGGEVKVLTRNERESVIAALEAEGDLTFNQLRKLLGLDKLAKEMAKATVAVEGGEKPKAKDFECKFNLETGGETRILGNRTAEKLRPIFAEGGIDRWERMEGDEKDAIVRDILDYQDEDALMRRAHEKWFLAPAKAREVARIQLEDDRARFSVRALRRLVPRMADGLPFMTARKDEYPASFQSIQSVDALPPVDKVITDLKNPAVMRALSEVRRVVNAVIRQYGKPVLIRVEMARELKKSRKQREAASKQNRDKEKVRDKAKALLRDAGIQFPSRQDIEKVLLAEECHWHCPYTGQSFGMRDLVGEHPRVDVEHIVPFSLCLDNTFLNKTLCFADENRHGKGQKTPWQAYHGDDQRYHEMLGRVKRFTGDEKAARVKLERFQLTDDKLRSPDSDLAGFTERHLRDTAYAARLACEYMGRLYGARPDGIAEDGKRRIQVSPGQATAYLRREWGMNGILDGDGIKTRKDHRHHAVDAIAIALTGPREVKLLADAAKAAAKYRQDRFEQVFQQIGPPWDGFLDDAKAQVSKVLVSSRVDRRLAGPLHEETNYGRERVVLEDKADKKTGKVKQVERSVRHVRKPVGPMLSEGDIEAIVDPVVRKAVQDAVAAGGGDPKKAFASGKDGRLASQPHLVAKDGRQIPIKRVRIAKTQTAVRVGGSNGTSERFVAPGSNHHMVVSVGAEAAVEDRGAIDWGSLSAADLEWVVVSRWEATRRSRMGEAIVQVPEGRRLLFTLSSGEFVEADMGKGRELLRVTGVSTVGGGRVDMIAQSDARDSTERRKLKEWNYWVSLGAFLKSQPTKVTLDPLGNLRHARD